MRRFCLGVALSVIAVVAPASTHADASRFPDCSPSSDTTFVVGTVSCRLVESAFVGGTTAFSYFVPPGCDPAVTADVRCPVLYLLHGFGGDYHGMLGTASNPSAWVAALSKGPPVDPHDVPDPWNHADPAAWVAKPALDLILVAPHGRSVPGGFGPAPELDSFWTDWNPRLAAGGDSQAYDTPPPRFSSFIRSELIPYVEAHFPAGEGREWRSLAGTSLGGYGSYLNGLQHPDVWTGMGSISGAHNFLFAPGFDPGRSSGPVGVSPPAPVPYVRPPSLSQLVPINALPAQIRGFAAALFVLGDPVTDGAHFRGTMPRDLAMNGRAFSGAGQSFYIRAFVNDAIPRRTADLANPASYLVDEGFELIVLPMNLEMQLAFYNESVATDFEIHQGLHSEIYRRAWLRGELEALYARVRHADGGGDPPPWPTSFDYRSTAKDFSVWGWSFSVEREPVEFLTLRDVSCEGLSLQGTGVVTVTVPASCGTGLDGEPTFEVDLGNPFPVDEQAGATAVPVYGNTVVVALSSL